MYWLLASLHLLRGVLDAVRLDQLLALQPRHQPLEPVDVDAVDVGRAVVCLSFGRSQHSS